MTDILKLQAERDALAAKLAELEKQEPIGEVTHSDVLPNAEKKYRHEFMSDFRIGVQAELYARPVPAEPHHKHAAPWLGWALHIIRERCPDVVTSHQFERAEDTKKACFAEGLDQAPAEPVNARLLEALKFVMSAHGEQLDLAFAQAQDAIACAEAALAAPQPDALEQARAEEREAWPDLTCVIRWLEAGHNPKEAAKALRLLQEKIRARGERKYPAPMRSSELRDDAMGVFKP